MQDLLIELQSLIASAPAPLAALVTSVAGTIPFVEGEGAAALAIIAGVNPVVAGIFAALGNLLCVAGVVFASSGARKAVIKRISAKRAQVAQQSKAPALVAAGSATVALEPQVAADQRSGKVESARTVARRQKFTNALEKYGVPGVSLLGPLLLPTAFTASMLTAVGVRPRWVMLWQTIAIVGWTTVLTVMAAVLVSNL